MHQDSLPEPDSGTGSSPRFVTEKIVISARPEVIWPVVANPFEFQENLCPWMRQTELLSDEENLSQVKVIVKYGLFPPFHYVCEFRYKHYSRIDFKCIGGAVKHFEGFWEIAAAERHDETSVSFGMYIDFGFLFRNPFCAMRSKQSSVTSCLAL